MKKEIIRFIILIILLLLGIIFLFMYNNQSTLV